MNWDDLVRELGSKNPIFKMMGYRAVQTAGQPDGGAVGPGVARQAALRAGPRHIRAGATGQAGGPTDLPIPADNSFRRFVNRRH